MRIGSWIVIAALLVGAPALSGDSKPAPDARSAVLGSWTGESLCVGDRPACKNEVVVYRFEPIAGVTNRVLWLADKIIEGKRVPMGKAEMTLDSSGKKLTWELAIHQTRAIWELMAEGDNMTGTLVLLPDRTLSRNVSVRRVEPDQVPKAPAREDYGE